jgi:tRNA modification GTPase
LNGRLDLTQAEAICDYIQSTSERMAHVARAQVDGALGSRVTALYEAMLAHCADVEHQLDFDEGDLSETFLLETTQALQKTMIPLSQLIQSWNTNGHVLRDGALVVLSGKPNAGKSSLLNALLGRNRAIVHHVPGTTRDVIEESLLVEGIPLRLADTAGLRSATDDVEQEGIARSRDLMKQADINLHLIDGSTATEEEMRDLQQDARSISVVTKSDLLLNTEFFQSSDERICVSAKTGTGLDLLTRAILKKLGVVNASAGTEIINQRHAQELRTAYTAAEQAHALLLQRDLVIAANELRVAAEALGRIVGRVYTDDLLESIFSRFCVGK